MLVSAVTLVVLLQLLLDSSPTGALIESLEEREQFSVKENSPAGTLVGRISRKSGFTYHLTEQDSYFSFDPGSGEIKTRQVIDRELIPSGRVDLVILGEEPAYFIAVRIEIEDINDNAPQFPHYFQNISISESTRVGSQTVLPDATDKDSDSNGRIAEYKIVSGNSQGLFRLVTDPKPSGQLSLILEVARELDRELESVHRLNISARDDGNPPLSSFVTIFVNVLDANDNAPEFSMPHFRISVPENAPIGFPVLRVNASDADVGPNAQISFSIASNSAQGATIDIDQFRIDQLTGSITTTRSLDCPLDSACAQSTSPTIAHNCSRVCVFAVEAKDHGTPVQRSQAYVDVALIDVNDHAPCILFKYYPAGAEYATIDEKKNLGAVVAVVTVLDEDTGPNGETIVEILAGNDLEHFKLETNEHFSLIKLAGKVNRKKVPMYNLTIAASDHGKPSKRSVRSLIVYVNDINDKPPVFEERSYNVSIAEDLPLGSYVAELKAFVKGDPLDQAIAYEIMNGNEMAWFKLNPRTGLLTAASELNFTLASRVTLAVSAQNIGPSHIGAAQTTVTVWLTHANRFPPRFVPSGGYRVEIPENAPVGSTVYQVNAVDSDKGPAGRVSYQLGEMADGRVPVLVDKWSGLLKLRTELDRETRDYFEVAIIASDQGNSPKSSRTAVRFIVTDVNDHTPEFHPTEYWVTVAKTTPSGTVLTHVSAFDADSGVNSQLSYSILNAPANSFEVASNGALVLRRLPYERDSIDVVIGCRDGGGLEAANNATVHISVVESRDHIPRFKKTTYNFTITETGSSTAPSEQVVGSVSAGDYEAHSQIIYTLAWGDKENSFEIGPYSGEIRARKYLDREKTAIYFLKVVAKGRLGTETADVTVNVADINDNAPSFSAAEAVGEVSRSAPAGSPVYFATATDPDEGRNGRLFYAFGGKNSSGIFGINSETGEIFLTQPGSTIFPSDSGFELAVVVSDFGEPKLSSEATVRIKIVNDLPDLSQIPDSITLILPENATYNQQLAKLNCSDPSVIFRADPDSAEALLGIFPDGSIYLKNPLDYETLSFAKFVFFAVTNNATILTKTTVNLHVIDVNDNKPVCGPNATSYFQVRENMPPLTYIGQVAVEDPDKIGFLTFKLETTTDLLYLDAVTGALYTRQWLDREKLVDDLSTSILTSAVIASDGDYSAKCTIYVEIADDNDNSPEFAQTLYEVTVSENKEVSSEILHLTATDRDNGDFGIVQFALKDPSCGPLALNESSGRLRLQKPGFDRENTTVHVCEVVAFDSGKPSLNTSVKVIISVADVNDMKPEFTGFDSQINVSESTLVGTVLTRFTASDGDEGNNGEFQFSLRMEDSERPFYLDFRLGTLILVRPLDYESTKTYQLTVIVTDRGVPQLSSNQSITLNVLDENDNAPKIVAQSLIAVLPENIELGSEVTTLRATDLDSEENGEVKFLLLNQSPVNAFSLDSRSGLVTTMTAIDRESVETFRLTVRVSDSPKNQSKALSSVHIITLTVTDVNDNPPQFASPMAGVVSMVDSVGHKIASIRAIDPDSGINASVAYRMVESRGAEIFGLGLDGSIYLRRSLPLNTDPTYKFTVEALDRTTRENRFTRNSDSISGNSRLSTKSEFTVIVRSSPKDYFRFEQPQFNFQIEENASVGTQLGTAKLSNPKQLPVEYFITGLQANGTTSSLPLSIDRKTGVVVVSGSVDCDAGGNQFSIEITAVVPVKANLISASCKAQITILDANDTPPKFTQELYELDVPENAMVGSVLTAIKALDPDTNGRMSYELIEAETPFQIDPSSGALRLTEPLDWERSSQYRLSLAVSDGVHRTTSLALVTVIDVNDNQPSFENRAYSFNMTRDAVPGTFVGAVRAKDPDQGLNGTVRYSAANYANEHALMVDSESGVISIAGYMNFHQHPILFTVLATDLGIPAQTSTTSVFISVKESDENGALFTTKLHSLSIAEDVKPGSILCQLPVDQSLFDPTVMMFSILSGDTFHQFLVSKNGSLLLRTPLDRETLSSYELTIAIQRLTRQLATIDVRLTITDVNDNAPKFDNLLTALVSESSPIGNIIAVLRASDPDLGTNSLVEFQLDSESGGMFSVDPVMGYVKVNGPLDREKKSSYNLTVWVVDRGNPSMRTRGFLVIELLDENDNRPEFVDQSYHTQVAENVLVGSKIIQLRVTDQDWGQNAAVNFMILEENNEANFAVDPSTNNLYVARELDYEHRSWYQLTICVANVDQTEDLDCADVTVNVTDENDNAPEFPLSPVTLEVYENLRATPVHFGSVRAVDLDSGRNGKISYSIIQGNTSVFQIDSISGDLRLQMPLDRENQDVYDLTITATDSGNPRLTGSGSAIVRVLDANDNAPQFFQPIYLASVPENSPAFTPVVEILATDLDLGPNGEIRYKLETEDVPFAIDEENGTLYTTAPLDRESSPSHKIVVIASDLGEGISLQNRVTVDIGVADENDNPPVITYPTLNDIIAPADQPSGMVVFVVGAEDADDGPNGRLIYTLDGPAVAQFDIDRLTGVVTARSQLLLGRIYRLQVTVSDLGFPSSFNETYQCTVYTKPLAQFPVFKRESTETPSFTVPEEKAGLEIARIIASSSKKSPLSKINYGIAAGGLKGSFYVDPIEGNLKTGAKLDREHMANHELWIFAADSDRPPLISYFKVQIEVSDTNDNPPEFSLAVYNASVPEEQPAPILVTQVEAVDLDAGENSALKYSLISGNEDDSFKIDPESGEIYTTTSLDREHLSFYELVVLAVDEGSPSHSSTAIVRVKVDDINDNAPRFTRLLRASVAEECEKGQFVIQAISVDPDAPENANNTYYLSQNPGNRFAIDPFSGNVTVNGRLDREEENEYSVRVLAVDGSWRIETALTITLIDLNDNAPVFENFAYFLSLSELQPALTTVGDVVALDKDASGPNSQIRFALKTRSDKFRIDSITGRISTLVPLNYFPGGEAANRISLTVIASDHGSPSLSNWTTVEINVVPRNHFEPKFAQSSYTAPVSSTARVGSEVLQVECVDPEETEVTFRLIEDAAGTFNIHDTTGAINLARKLEGREGQSYQLVIVASDSGTPPKSASATINLVITGENLHRPEFSSSTYNTTIVENAPLGTVIYRLIATDSDRGLNGELRYAIIKGNSDGNFRIDAESGIITIAKNIDYEANPAYALSVMATDQAYDKKSATATVFVGIDDLNDCPPRFENSHYEIYVTESLAVGSEVLHLIAKDADSSPNGQTLFSLIAAEKTPFSINASTGLLYLRTKLDFEIQGYYSLRIIARNIGSSLAVEASVDIYVQGENEFLPEFDTPRYQFNVPRQAPIRTVLGRIGAKDDDAGLDGIVEYFLDPQTRRNGFEIDAERGFLYLTKVWENTASEHLKVYAWNPKSRNPGPPATVDVLISTEPSGKAFQLPEFDQKLFSGSVVENAPVGTTILRVAARFATGYKITEGNEELQFSVTEVGVVEVAKRIDREERDHYNLTIVALNQLGEEFGSSCRVNINVLDVNDNPPHLPAESRVGYVMEGDPDGTHIMTLTPVDSDLLPNQGPYRFSLDDQPREANFDIDEVTGIIRTLRVFDRELVPEYQLRVRMTDGGKPAQTSTEVVTIKIRDVNDLPPESRSYTVKLLAVDQPSAIRNALVPLKPRDPDEIGDYQCVLTKDSPDEFEIERDCLLYSTKGLPTQGSYTLFLSGTDGIHAWVSYNVTMEYRLLDDVVLQKSVDLIVAEYRSIFDIVQLLQSVGSQQRKKISIIGVSEATNRLVVTVALWELDETLLDAQIAEEILRNAFAQRNPAYPGDADQVYITSDPCSKRPCKNGGSCGMDLKAGWKSSVFDSGIEDIVYAFPEISRDYACHCTKTFTGKHCELAVDHCANSPCENGGTCQFDVDSGDIKCECPAGLEGARCEVDTDECAKISPCKNGGYCENTFGSFRCICLLGFAGLNCEQTVDHCASDPCLNGGKCRGVQEGFVCRCEFGFTGKLCEIESLGFDYLSYIQLPPLDPHKNNLTLEFATLEPNGVLLYSYNEAPGSVDYVAVDIVEGQIRLSGKLAGYGQMNMVLSKKVNTGQWQQLRILHQHQSVTISIGECVLGETSCEQCVRGDRSCSITADTGTPQILVPGRVVYIGGVALFEQLVRRPGQVSHYGFRGCLRDFESNGRRLSDIQGKIMHKVVNGCPRSSGGLCQDATMCGLEGSCLDRWNHYLCNCPGGFLAKSCNDGGKSVFVSGGAFIEYQLSEMYRRELIFRPVAPNSIVNSDDLFRAKRDISAEPDHWLHLEFRSNKPYGMLFWSGSGPDEFTMIDLFNGSVRYTMKVKGTGPTSIQLGDIEASLTDGNWHQVSLALYQRGKKLEFRADSYGKDARFRVPVHNFLGHRVTKMTLGGIPYNMQINEQDLTSFDGCFSKFILDGELQPLEEGQSNLLTAELFRSTNGKISDSCGGSLDCSNPPCTAPVDSALGMKIGLVAVVIFFTALITVIFITFFVVRRLKQRKLPASEPETPETSPCSKVTNLPTTVTSSAFTNLTNLSLGNISMGRPMGSNNHRLDVPHNLDLPRTTSHRPYQDRFSSLDPVSRYSGLTAINNLHVGNGAYSNNLDPTGDEIPEHYDLDNASSIAPSDVDIAYHYKDYRMGGSHRGIKQLVVTNSSGDHLDFRHVGQQPTPNHRRAKPRSQRGVPAAILNDSVSSDVRDPRRRSKRRTPNSGGSASRQMKGSRSAPNQHSMLSIESVSKERSGGSRHARRSTESSSQSEDQVRRSRSRRSSGAAPRIISRSPHAPPLHDSSSEALSTDSDLRPVPSTSFQHFTPVSHLNSSRSSHGSKRRHRASRNYLPDETETESEVLGSSVPPLIRRPRPLNLQSPTAAGLSFTPFNAATSEDDELTDAPGNAIPDLSHFVNRSGELKNLMLGRNLSSSDESGGEERRPGRGSNLVNSGPISIDHDGNPIHSENMSNLEAFV